MTREELQTQSLSLIQRSNRVALQWCTGLGKSRAAIEMANYLQNNKKDNIKVLLVVAEIAHKSNWEKELDKWNFKSNDLTIVCYASLRKYKDSQWDLIIFDEAHHLGSDLRTELLFNIIAENIILLSATLPDHIMQTISMIFGKFEVSKVSLKQAIEWNILPQPKVYLIPLTLDSKYYDCTIIEEWGKKEIRTTYKCKFHQRWEYLRNKHKYPNATLEISCTQQQKYDYLSEQFEYWKSQFLKTKQEFVKNKWLQIGSKRKRFLGESKTSDVEMLLRKLQNKRFICFCASVEQAILLGGKNAIHSKKVDSLNVIDSFNLKKIDNLFAVGMLQEGQNLNDIKAGVIVQLDGQERAFIQKFGRSMRADDPVQFIFYYKNTRDVDYLKNILEDINEEYVVEIDNLSKWNYDNSMFK